jgi:hypothetical protein
MRSLDAAETVRSVTEEFRKKWRNAVSGCGYRWKSARIKADESALGRALWNLLDNCREVLRRQPGHRCLASARWLAVSVSVTDRASASRP